MATVVPNKEPPRRTLAAIFLLAVFGTFALAWSAVTLFIDVMLVHDISGQLQSLGYESVEGKILKCRIQRTGHEEFERHRVDIEYAYSVDQVSYTGHSVCAGELATAGAVAAFVADHPVGGRVSVYYDPADPGTAVLLRGISNETLIVALFSIPFNAVLGMLCVCCGFLTIRPFLSEATKQRLLAGVRVLHRGDEVRIRPSRVGPVWAAFGAAFVVPIPICLMIGVWAGLGQPPIVLAAGLAVVFASIALAYTKVARRYASGRDDLVINQQQNTVGLPSTFGRKEQTTFPLDALNSVQISEREFADAEGGRDFVFPVSAHWRDGTGGLKEATLMETATRRQADAVLAIIQAHLAPQTPCRQQPRG